MPHVHASPLRSVTNPVLVHVERGGRLESQHRGAIAVVRRGEPVFALGDVDAPVFTLSAVKSFQALAALHAGVADRFALADEALALMCASHSGEPRHVEVAARMLALGGLGVEDLRCGAHAPFGRAAADALVRSGEAPSALHHNCSGKHAGMLLACRAAGASTADYLDPAHPLQRAIRATLVRVLGVDDASIAHAVDGCSAPTWILPLRALARGFAALANPRLAPDVDRARLARLRDAQAAHPDLVGGAQQRFDTDFIRAGRGRLFSKVGAEGVLAVGVRGEDLGIAIKIDDGNERAYVPAMLAVLERLDVLSADEREALAPWFDRRTFNHARLHVGHVAVAFEGP